MSPSSKPLPLTGVHEALSRSHAPARQPQHPPGAETHPLEPMHPLARPWLPLLPLRGRGVAAIDEVVDVRFESLQAARDSAGRPASRPADGPGGGPL